jgi:hypothetical protein
MMGDREAVLRYFSELLEPITADKRGIVIPRSSLRRLRLLLDDARNEVPFKCEGDMLYADSDSTGLITVRLNSESEDPWPIKAQGGVQNVPIREILVTHAAQAGKFLNLWYGYRARFVAPSQDIATIGSITNTVTIQNAGVNYGASFTSTVALLADTNEQIIAPAANLNGVKFVSAWSFSQWAAGMQQFVMLAKSSAPASVSDGALLGLAQTWVTFAGAFQAMWAAQQAHLVSSGKGMYFRNGPAAAQIGALRGLNYTVL